MQTFLFWCEFSKQTVLHVDGNCFSALFCGLLMIISHSCKVQNNKEEQYG